MHVIATAGHVDHGKSTLVQALTGRDPDRLAEEKRRGLTIDLGFAWVDLPTPTVLQEPSTEAPSSSAVAAAGATVAFVDVPGHERFITTTLAGVGPAPAVMFVVAADEGWRQQSSEHLAAIDALGLTRGLLVVSRSDLADPAAAMADAQARITRSSLGEVAALAVSAVDGRGLPQLRGALFNLVSSLPPPDPAGRVRVWVDRSFSVRGVGTVVTGTLGTGTIALGDRLQWGRLHADTVQVRGLQSLDQPRASVGAVARVAINLRDVRADEVARGDVLLTPGQWRLTEVVEVRLRPSLSPNPASAGPASAGPARQPSIPGLDLPTHLILHVGTAAVPVRVRMLGADTARLTLAAPLPLEPGDRLVLRDPGRRMIMAGATVLDVDPPVLRRRGAAVTRGADLERLATADSAALLAEQVTRREAVRRSELAAAGVALVPSPAVQVIGEWLIARTTWDAWIARLRTMVAERATDPLDPGITDEAARAQLALPDRALLAPLIAEGGFVHREGRISLRPATASTDLGASAEAGLRELTAHLTNAPFAAPERPELEGWHLGSRELAAAERAGRLVRITPDIVLLPRAPAEAMAILATLPQPFTTSEARQALRTTRRVVIPLLEHLDGRGWTLRRDAGHREVRRSR